MRKAFVVLIAVLALLSSMPAIAEEGRYQAIDIGRIDTGTAVLIIDTKEGHLWMWVLEGLSETRTVGSTILFYQGQVRPETKPGERIYRERVGW